MKDKPRFLVVVFDEPLAVPDDLISEAKRLDADVLANDEGELLFLFPDMRLTLCRSFYERAKRLGVPVKRGYRTRPKFTLHSGMDVNANKAYLFGAHRLNSLPMRNGKTLHDLACPWCGFVGKLRVHQGNGNPWMPELKPSTTIACYQCHREATVAETVPAGYHHELLEWLEGIDMVAPAYESEAHKAQVRAIADEIRKASPERRRRMGLGPSPTGNHSKRNGPLSRQASGPRVRPTTE